jgi:hypothetical protein
VCVSIVTDWGQARARCTLSRPKQLARIQISVALNLLEIDLALAFAVVRLLPTGGQVEHVGFVKAAFDEPLHGLRGQDEHLVAVSLQTESFQIPEHGIASSGATKIFVDNQTADFGKPIFELLELATRDLQKQTKTRVSWDQSIGLKTLTNGVVPRVNVVLFNVLFQHGLGPINQRTGLDEWYDQGVDLAHVQDGRLPDALVQVGRD